jgi:hypothetical protein
MWIDIVCKELWNILKLKKIILLFVKASLLNKVHLALIISVARTAYVLGKDITVY